MEALRAKTETFKAMDLCCFGVWLTDGSYIKRSFSMVNLENYHSSSSIAMLDSHNGCHSIGLGRGSTMCDVVRKEGWQHQIREGKRV